MSKFDLPIGDGDYLSFELDLFDNKKDVDLDKLLRIDYSNILPEKITFPPVVTRFGVLLSKSEMKLREEEINYKIWKAKERESIRSKWDNDKDRPVVRGAKFTKDEVEDELIKSKKYKIKKYKINKLIYEKEVINSLYWGAKTKLDRLNSISIDIDAKQAKKIKEFKGIEIK